MASFAGALLHTIQHEGGYVYHPDDPGGETKYGISKRSYPQLDIARLTFAQAKQIYQRDYWDPLHLDEVHDQDLAGQVFDFAVHAGQRTAIRMLQQAYNRISLHHGIAADGLIGPETLAAINDEEMLPDLLRSYKVHRGAHYLRLASQDIAQEVFFRGWLRRLEL